MSWLADQWSWFADQMTWFADPSYPADSPAALTLVALFVVLVILANVRMYVDIPLPAGWFNKSSRRVTHSFHSTNAGAFAARDVEMERDYRDAELPDGMTAEEWVSNFCVPEILMVLQEGEHEVDLTMPRWMQREHFAEYDGWIAPAQVAFCKNRIHVLRETLLYDSASETSLIRYLRIIIGDAHP